jgi:hypothetical protein
LIQKAEHILSVFRDHPEKCSPIKDRALEIKKQLERISPFIDRYSATTCSKCSSKCCINRYAYYTTDDLIYFYALDVCPEVQELQSSIHEEQCQFLTDSGCALERYKRPLGCTWHFCDYLTIHIQKESRDSYLDFSDAFDTLFLMWIELTRAFRTLYREVYGQDLDEGSSKKKTHGLTFPWARVRPTPFSSEASPKRSRKP